MKYVYKYKVDDLYKIREDLTAIKPGDHVIVYTRENILTGEETYYVSKEWAADGIGGNMDWSEKRFHGWRGTTDNIALYALGVYSVKSVEINDRADFNETYLTIRLNRTDLAKEKS